MGDNVPLKGMPPWPGLGSVTWSRPTRAAGLRNSIMGVPVIYNSYLPEGIIYLHPATKLEPQPEEFEE